VIERVAQPAAANTAGAARNAEYTVLLIAGAGRSGSTLLELMLDQVPGVTAVGELTDIWDAALGRNELCGCGKPFADCPFWTDVGARAFGGWDAADAERMLAIHDSVARNRHFLRLLTSSLAPSFRARLDDYAVAVSRILDAVAAVSGCRTIVDASKWPSHAMVLRRSLGYELRMVQLVRDPRGVAYSWARRLERPHAPDSAAQDWGEMRRDRPLTSAAHWTALNLGIDLVAALGVPRHFVRYEELVAAPSEMVAGILARAGHAPGPGALDFIDGQTVHLAAGHGIAGNPSRFRQGEVRLRAGEEWSTEMPRRERLLVGAITWPLELAYRRRGAGAADEPDPS
jgi:Sulfotransferase family